jgi:multiple sugar transport system permease protein
MAATAVPTAIASPQKTKKQRISKLGRYRARWGLIFISPWIIGFLVFTLVPMLASLWFTTLDLTPATPELTKFIGLGNWQHALFGDPDVAGSFVRTFQLGLIAIPLGTGFTIMLALLMNSPLVFGKTFFRTLFYMPYIFPGIATAIIWLEVFNENTGWVNMLIQNLTGLHVTGQHGLRWFADPTIIYPALSMMGLWGVGNSMLVYIAGLQNVPTELYEAAEMDGASWLQRLWRITLPMISPVIFYNVVLGLIGLMQYFQIPYVLNAGSGGPQNSTRFIMVWFYKQAFGFQNMGYGATLAWLIFIVALIITGLFFGTARYWVYYASEEA